MPRVHRILFCFIAFLTCKKLAWDNRKEAVTEAIRELDADIIAFQEMETFAGGSFNTENKQLDWVLQHFPEYRAGAYGDAAVYPNTQPILYKHERFTEKDQGFFFFSDTPDIIYSRTFNGSWPKSALLVKERIKPVVDSNQAVILIGDINAPSFSPTAGKLKGIPLNLAKPPGATFHFNRGLNLIPAIDHIFYSDNITLIGKTHRLRKKYNGVYPKNTSPQAYQH